MLLPIVIAQGGGEGDLHVPEDAGVKIVARYVRLLAAYKQYNDFKKDKRVALDKIAALTLMAALCVGGVHCPNGGVNTKVAALVNTGYGLEVLRYILKLPSAFTDSADAREVTFFVRTFYREHNDLDVLPSQATKAALVMACRLLYARYHKTSLANERGE